MVMSDAVEQARKVVFALHLAEGLSVIKASAAASIQPHQGYTWRKDPAVQAELARLQAEIKTRLYRRIASLGDAALDVYDRALNEKGDRPPSREAVNLAKDVLDRLGLSTQALTDFLGAPDEPVTIVVPLPVIADAREQQEARRAGRLQRQRDAGLIGPGQP